jgi:hypothetical protein
MNFKDLVDDMLGVLTETFGEAVYYQHKKLKAQPYKITAVFDEMWEFTDPQTQAVVSTNAPRLGIRMSDLRVTPEQDDKVIIGKRHFLVKDSLEDGQGGAYLMLHLDYEEVTR